MSMEYIRWRYEVPAKRGGQIAYRGQPAVITGCSGPYLIIRIDGDERALCVHPTWQIEYPERATGPERKGA